MPRYNRYQKLQKYYLGEPISPPEYKQGTLITTGEWDSIEDCENDIIPGSFDWKVVPNEYICVETDEVNIFEKYEKLQAYNKDTGEAIEPPQYKQGSLITTGEWENINDCNDGKSPITWVEVEYQYICELENGEYVRYQKLQAYEDDTPVEPAQYKKGNKVEGDTFDNIDDCQYYFNKIMMDVVLADKNSGNISIVKKDDFNFNTYLNGYEPIGIVVVPFEHNVYEDNSCGVMGLRFLSDSNKEYGSSQLNEIIITDVTQLLGTLIDYTVRYPYIINDSKQRLLAWNTQSFIPSDIFSKEFDTARSDMCIHDNNSYYTPSTVNRGQSPYLTDGSRNTVYLDHIDTGTSPDIMNGYNIYNGRELSPSIDFHTISTGKGDWYIPATGELRYMMSRLGSITWTLRALKNRYSIDIMDKFDEYNVPGKSPKIVASNISRDNDDPSKSIMLNYMSALLSDDDYHYFNLGLHSIVHAIGVDDLTKINYIPFMRLDESYNIINT